MRKVIHASRPSRRSVMRMLGAATLAAAASSKSGPLFAEALQPLGGDRICPQGDCGYRYDPRIGDPDGGIPPGTAFADLPDDWECPECGTQKEYW